MTTFLTDAGIRTQPSDAVDCIRVNIYDAVTIVSDFVGGGAHLDPTGGNCAAITVDNLEGGAWLNVVDGDVFTYSDGEWQEFYGGWRAAVYHAQHADGCEAKYAATGPDGDCSADALRATIHRALAGATDHLKG